MHAHVCVYTCTHPCKRLAGGRTISGHRMAADTAELAVMPGSPLPAPGFGLLGWPLRQRGGFITRESCWERGLEATVFLSQYFCGRALVLVALAKERVLLKISVQLENV